MLYLSYAPLRRVLSDHIISAVCENAANGIGRQILIVPEQFSFDAEIKLCERGGDAIPRFAEVLSFTRLASRVFSTVGGAAVQTLDKSGRLIAMAGALEQVRSRLKIYGTYITKPEFLLQLLQISDEFKSYGVSSEAVRRVFPALTGTLAEKIEELTLILEAYDAVCAGSKLDPAVRLDALAAALTEHDYAEGRQIYIDGFTDFTAQELQVIGALLRSAEHVTVCLCCDGLLHGQSVFAPVRDTAKALSQLAGRYGIAVAQLPVPMPSGEGCLSYLQEHLFSSALPVCEGRAEEITLSDAEAVYDEAMYAVGHIQRLLLQGARLRDIAVACTDASYLPALESLLQRYRLSCYFSGVQDVLQKNVLRGVLSAIHAAATGMDAEDVADYLNSGISGLSADACDRLKNYAFVWNIRGTVWDRAFTYDPLGYDANDPEQSARLLRELNEARETAITPLSALRDALSAAKNTAGQVLAVNRFAEQICLRQQLSDRAEALSREGQLQKSQEYSQLYDILTDTMEQIYGVLGETVRTPEEFCNFFRATLSQHSIGTIPATLDCIHAGLLSSMRNIRTKHLLLLGASDGLLPTGATPAGLLSDAERKTLTQAGLTLAPDAGARLSRELLEAYGVMTAPTQTLYVSCKSDEPSYLYERLKKLFPHCAVSHPQPLPVTALQAAQAALQSQTEIDDPALRAASDRLKTRAAYTPGTLSQSTVEALYGRQIRLSASKIDKFASCKYAYFLRYGLKAEERKQASVDAPMFGTFVHFVLENTARQVMAEGGFRTVTEDRLNELAGIYIEQFIREHLNGLEDKTEREIILFRRNLEEVRGVVRELWEELRQSEYIPEGFELEFFGDAAVEVTGKNASCRIVGMVDRADLYRADGRTYLRIVDYKTGLKTFDYTDILSGIGLQMLIYLFALQSQADGRFGGPVTPAGVLYFPARLPVLSGTGKLSDEEAEKDRRSQLRRKGLLLDDEKSLQAMEQTDGSPRYLPFRVLKSGERSGSLATAEQMSLLKAHVFRTLANMTDEIFSGKLAPDPYARGASESACRYCEYKTVCHIESGKIAVRNFKATPADRFWEILEKEAEEDV